MRTDLNPYVVKQDTRFVDALPKLANLLSRRREYSAESLWWLEHRRPVLLPFQRDANQPLATLVVVNEEEQPVGLLTEATALTSLATLIPEADPSSSHYRPGVDPHAASYVSVDQIMTRDVPRISLRDRPWSPHIIALGLVGAELIVVTDDQDRLAFLLDGRSSPLELVLSLSALAPDKPVTSLSRNASRESASLDPWLSESKVLANLPRNEFGSLQAVGLLDDYYLALEEADRLIAKLEKRGFASAPPIHEQLQNRMTEVLEEYKSLMKPFPSQAFGPEAARNRPDIVFVLGCRSEEERRERTQQGVAAALRQEGSTLVLSGGGWEMSRSEAEAMAALVPPEFPREVITETDSIDTVGNAVLGRLTLMAHRVHPPDGPSRNICVVTSAYHAARAHKVFSWVFDPYDRVAVEPVPYDAPGSDPIKRATEQLRGEHRTTLRSLSFLSPMTGQRHLIRQGDLRTVFLQMMMDHDYYSSRADLLRKYSALLEFTQPGQSETL